MNTYLNNRLGYCLILLALLHQLVGVAVYGQVLISIAQAGVINTINPPFWDRDAAFWFFIFGFMLALYGAMTQWLINQHYELPSFWGWGLLLVCGFGAALMPASGFWVGGVIAILMIRRRHERSTTNANLTAA